MCVVSINLSQVRNRRYQGLTNCSHLGIDQHFMESTDKHAEEARPCWNFLPYALHHLRFNRESRRCHKWSTDRLDMGSFLGWNRSQCW